MKKRSSREREYTPLPFEYLEDMERLTDEEFGRLLRALIRYARDRVPIELEGPAGFYSNIVMHKDDRYALSFEEDRQKAEARSDHARKAAISRYERPEEPPEEAEPCSRTPEQTIPSQAISTQTTPTQLNLTPSLSAEREDSPARQAEPCPAAPAAVLPLLGEKELPIAEKSVAKWQAAFPAVDVQQELLQMAVWLEANPEKLKSARGTRRFIVRWLSREQDRGGSRPSSPRAKAKPQPQAPILEE